MTTLFYDIYAARIATDGTVVDPQGIAIATGSTLRAPLVASNGGNYLVAWQESGEDTLLASTARRFNTSLEPIETKPFPVALSPNAYALAIASNGTTFLVAWQDSRAFENTAVDIVGFRLSSTGSHLDPNGIRDLKRSRAAARASNGFQRTRLPRRPGRTIAAVSAGTTRTCTRRASPAAGLVLDAAAFPVCTQPHAQDQIHAL